MKGEKVILRPLDDRDLLYWQKWINDQEIARNTLQFRPMTEHDEREWYEKYRKDPNAFMFSVVTHDGKLIGNIGLFGVNWRDRVANTGTLIGEKEYQGKGYGSDAKMLLLHYAFHTLNLRKICSSALAFNEASLRYNIKCGYHEEGRRKDQYFRDGRYWDEILIAVFREDWEPLWEKYQAGTF